MKIYKHNINIIYPFIINLFLIVNCTNLNKNNIFETSKDAIIQYQQNSLINESHNYSQNKLKTIQKQNDEYKQTIEVIIEKEKSNLPNNNQLNENISKYNSFKKELQNAYNIKALRIKTYLEELKNKNNKKDESCLICKEAKKECDHNHNDNHNHNHNDLFYFKHNDDCKFHIHKSCLIEWFKIKFCCPYCKQSINDSIIYDLFSNNINIEKAKEIIKEHGKNIKLLEETKGKILDCEQFIFNFENLIDIKLILNAKLELESLKNKEVILSNKTTEFCNEFYKKLKGYIKNEELILKQQELLKDIKRKNNIKKEIM